MTHHTQGNTPHTVLYTRNGCHLCDEARSTLEAHGLQPESVDIDRDEELQAEFDTCVPVVKINGKVRFRGRVDRILLKRLLEGLRRAADD